MSIRICMDCREILGHIEDGRGDEIFGMSHGLCDDCANERRKELVEFKAKVNNKALNAGIIASFGIAVVIAGTFFHYANIILN